MADKTYDLIVIGGGPGGYLAAERAGHADLSVLLFEKAQLGGVCLNEGCIPSKTFLHSGKVFEHASDGKAFGVTADNARIDQKAVVKRKNKVVKTNVLGVKNKMKMNKVTVVYAEAKLAGRNGSKFMIVADKKNYEAKNVILAIGSEAIVPPIKGVKEGLESGFVLSSKEILDLETIPERLVVIGGGVIGLEMASYFQTVGSEVTVVEMLDHIAGDIDKEVGDLLQKTYAGKGMKFNLNSQVTVVKDGQVKFEHNGKSEMVPADKVLLSVGRRPLIQNLDLESLGIYTEHGYIVTDDRGQTNVPGVYAVGDVNGRWMLAHAAYREAEVAIKTILGGKDNVRYNALPSVVYTNPEVAYVGLTEEECKEQDIEYQKVSIPMSYSGRFVAETNRERSLCKIIVDPVHNRLIGCHLLGSYASELIISAGIMVETELTIEEIKELVFPHPTVAEVIREAIFILD
ncbi:MAG: dihydrolipoyl dehydrogenase [Clostridiaceae bacterium]|nr:dihydrolipoyl dehydrogenase [Clostridiaceae bacterium]